MYINSAFVTLVYHTDVTGSDIQLDIFFSHQGYSCTITVRSEVLESFDGLSDKKIALLNGGLVRFLITLFTLK